jgi:hypothetical protein
MFCPNCGRDNSNELKFCASCGTDLDAVSRALTGREDDVVTRLDAGLDHFIGRYAEHIFPEPKIARQENSVVRSWRILGQAFVTSLIDLFMFIIMWNILPARLMLLLVTTPVRLLIGKNRHSDELNELEPAYRTPELEERRRSLILERGAPSVTEGTTTNLGGKSRKRSEAPITGKIE